MPRVEIQMPDKIVFTTQFTVRIGDIGGVHLSNNVLVSYLNDALIQMIKSKGFKDITIDGTAFIIGDLAVIYKSESFHGDVLQVEMAVGDVYEHGCDIVYRVTNTGTGELTAIAKTGTVFFDYTTRKVGKIPEKFRELFF